MRSYPSWIAGLQYRAPDGTDRTKYCAGLSPGTALRLMREPSNPHDDNAVSFHHGARHLGYVPRKHSWVGRAMDEGKSLECEIIEIELSGSVFSRRAEHVETRISVVDSAPVIDAAAAAAAIAKKTRKEREDRARNACVDGLRVLAYLTLVDGVRAPNEHNIEISVIESRLIVAGFDRDPDILAMLAEQAAALSVTKTAMTRSVNRLAKDEAYFRLVYDAANTIAGFDGSTDKGEAEVLDRLKRAGEQNGWL